MSAFDPEEFMNTQVKGAIDTTIIPVPEGEYLGQIVGQLKTRTLEDGTVVMDVSWEILDDKVKEITGLDRPICRQGVWLDLTDEGGLDLSKGKNRGIGLLREAVGQNTEKAWAPSMLMGQTATVRVEHSPNANDPTSPYANVRRVTKVGAKKAA